MSSHPKWTTWEQKDLNKWHNRFNNGRDSIPLSEFSNRIGNGPTSSTVGEIDRRGANTRGDTRFAGSRSQGTIPAEQHSSSDNRTRLSSGSAESSNGRNSFRNTNRQSVESSRGSIQRNTGGSVVRDRSSGQGGAVRRNPTGSRQFSPYDRQLPGTVRNYEHETGTISVSTKPNVSSTSSTLHHRNQRPTSQSISGGSGTSIHLDQIAAAAGASGVSTAVEASTASILSGIAGSALLPGTIAGLGVGGILANHVRTHGLTLPGSDYIGPGNKIRIDAPRHAADAIAKDHDISYHTLINDLRANKITYNQFVSKIQDADVDSIKQFADEYNKSGSIHAWLASKGLSLKNTFESRFGHVYPQGKCLKYQKPTNPLNREKIGILLTEENNYTRYVNGKNLNIILIGLQKRILRRKLERMLHLRRHIRLLSRRLIQKAVPKIHPVHRNQRRR